MNAYRTILKHNKFSSCRARLRTSRRILLRNDQCSASFPGEPQRKCFHTLSSSNSFMNLSSHAQTEEENKRYNLFEIKCNRFSVSATNRNNDDEYIDEKKLSYSQRGKILWKRYGYVFIATYLTVYVTTLTSLYVGIDSGWIDPSNFILSEGETAIEAVQKDEEESMGPTPTGLAKLAIEKIGKFEFMKPYIPKIENNPQLLNLGVAWISTKLLEPLRLAISVTIVPSIARTLGYAPPKDKQKRKI